MTSWPAIIIIYLAMTKNLADPATTTILPTSVPTSSSTPVEYTPGYGQSSQAATTTNSGKASKPSSLVNAPDLIAAFLKRPMAEIAKILLSPGVKQLLKEQGLDQVVNRVLAGQAPGADVTKLLTGALEKPGVGLKLMELLQGSDGASNLSTTQSTAVNSSTSENTARTSNATWNATEDDADDVTLDDVILYISSTFGGSTYVTEAMENVKEILDRVTVAFGVGCTSEVKAIHALLDIIICTFTGNADSAIDQMRSFAVKDFDLLFRSAVRLFKVPEKSALEVLEHAKTALKQVMTFIKDNRNLVDMMVTYVKPEEDNKKDEKDFLSKNGANFPKQNTIAGRSRSMKGDDYNTYAYDVNDRNVASPQKNGRNNGIDYNSANGNDDRGGINYILQINFQSIATRAKKVIDLMRSLFQGQKSVTETLSIGQDIAGSLKRLLNREHSTIHKLVTFLERAVCILRDTPDYDIREDLTQAGVASRQLLTLVPIYVTSTSDDGSVQGASRLLKEMEEFLQRVVVVGQRWDERRSFYNKK